MGRGLHGLIGFLICLLAPFFAYTQQPVGQFSADVVSGCTPLIVKFSDRSTNNPTSWNWDLGNGTISNVKDPVTSYFLPGLYTVTLTVTNAAGSSTVIKTDYITAHPVPIADFSSTDTSGCLPFEARFTDASGGNVTQWEWNFGDGTTSTQKNPSHLYASPGTYGIYLKVTNNVGCSNVLFRPNYITVGGAKAAFSFNAPVYCNFPVSIPFKNETVASGNVSYSWDFGDGTPVSNDANPVHNYTNFGNYTIALIVAAGNGCSDTIRKTVSLPNRVTRFSGPDSLCIGQVATFNVTSTPTPVNILWTLGDGSTSTSSTVRHTYKTAGTYRVSMTNDFIGCSDSAFKNVVIIDSPAVSFTAPVTKSCKTPLTVNFQASGSGIVKWQWEFGDGATSTEQNPAHTYTKAGYFNVRLVATNANGCSSVQKIDSFVQIIPAALGVFNLPSNGCAPYTFSPIASFTSLDGIASIAWDFGDGYTTTGQNPSHTYTTPGVYTFRVRLVTNSGCTDSLVFPNSIRVGLPVVVDFTANPTMVCAGSPVSFAAAVSGPSLTYAWEFGDGKNAFTSNPVTQYKDTGKFDVRLVVTSSGCVSSLTKPGFITVRGTVSRFTAQPECAQRRTINFKNNSISAVTQHWDFGDGVTSTAVNPVHTYSTPGVYQVRLITTNNSCNDTSYQNVVASSVPVNVTISKDTLCKGESAIISIIHPHPELIAGYYWNFDGSNVYQSSGATYNRQFNTSGTYTFKAYTVDRAGCTDTIIKPNFVRVNGPTPWFGSSDINGCSGTTIDFLDSTVNDGVNRVNRWTWDYGDGSIETLTAGPFRHVYASTGSYRVKLRVQDQSGCSDTVSRINVVGSFEAKANFSSIDTVSCPGEEVAFSNLSSGSIASYAWDFGDGTTSNARTPLHRYSDTGSYSVRLTVTTATGCANTFTRTNYIKTNRPLARFRVSDSMTTCAPLQVNFRDSSVGNVSWNWSFGDGSFAAVKNPAKVYAVPGDFIAKLVVISANGCKDSAFQTLKIAGPYGVVTYSPKIGCSPVEVSFKAETNGAANFTWDFDDGVVVASNDSTIVHTYSSGGTYLPRVLLKDNSGCTIAFSGTDTIFAERLLPRFTVDKTQLCDSGTVVFTDQSTSVGRLSYLWDFGDGNRSTTSNPVHRYLLPGVYSVKLVISSYGCTDSVISSSLIRVFKSPSASILADSIACAPATITFNSVVATDTSAIVRWQWSFANGQTSNLQNPPGQTFNAAGTLVNRLTITNSRGCSSTVEKAIVINVLPSISLGTDTTICRGDSIRLRSTGATTVSWSPADNLSCTTCLEPFAYPSEDRIYRVKAMSGFCSSEDSILVKVQQPYKVAVQSGATAICAGTAVQLNASGAPNYLWTPNRGLNANMISNPVATPDSSISYKVLGYDTLGCFNDTGFVSINVTSKPTVSLGPDINLLSGGNSVLTPVVSTDVTRYQWTPVAGLSCSGCANPVATPKTTTTYKLTVQNGGGCTAEDSVKVLVLCDENSTLFIPNTFSPNGDGANDVFYVRGRSMSIQSMQVFNRWGELVFDRKNISVNNAADGWDGTFKGRKADAGVFIYVVTVSCSAGKPLKYTGNITLIQ
ncbi:PKD domain-containing protein [Segetibacter sp. 3557_3]|uniref:PKD domain-containing protein n=1 Tax=Segetibacter sp. 3557_3 TaxID=2547429 RepID=UPI0010589803|nr:PKD domain-containing protein [Segetibacter sp. 3557_3]TDH25495.1 PKD domain-containing protein [Segetibacter sp. 3557_3]